MGVSLGDHIVCTGCRDTVDQVPMVRIPNGGFRDAGFVLLEGRDSGGIRDPQERLRGRLASD